MLFNSYTFILLFVPLTWGLFALALRAGRPSMALAVLGLASWLFYAWWEPAYVPLLLGSIVFNYAVGRRIEHSAQVSAWLAFGIAANLALLGGFKYTGFITENLQALGVDVAVTRLDLPLAISFFTFQQIAYLVGIYRRQLASPKFGIYGMVVVFFPHLIAGPIVHYHDLVPQFEKMRRVAASDVARGMTLFAIGLFKKVMLADPVGQVADQMFGLVAAGQTLALRDAWMAAVSYSLQLYLDFSGYSDMALGLALLFGITLPINFNSPYKATSISDFWRRWNITVSEFLRDYLFIPLGGSRRGIARTMANLTATMAIGGLWHGAGWTFVLWGVWHGWWLAVGAAIRQIGVPVPRLLGWMATMLVVVFGWVLFRAPDLGDALSIWSSMLGGGGDQVVGKARDWRLIAGQALMVLLLPNAVQWVSGEPPTRWNWRPHPVTVVGTLAAFGTAVVALSDPAIFIYFNF